MPITLWTCVLPIIAVVALTRVGIVLRRRLRVPAHAIGKCFLLHGACPAGGEPSGESL